jgi:hypothetical protein
MRRVALYQLGQALQVVLRAACWHRLAELAVTCGLAQMQIGDAQALLCWPPQRMFGKEVQGLKGPLHRAMWSVLGCDRVIH